MNKSSMNKPVTHNAIAQAKQRLRKASRRISRLGIFHGPQGVESYHRAHGAIDRKWRHLQEKIIYHV